MGKIDTKRLITSRNHCGFSQMFVALSVGVAPSVVSRWENGIKTPSRDNLTKLADLYGVSLDYLIGRTDDETNVDFPRFTTEEIKLIYKYRQLSEKNRATIYDNILFLITKQSEEKETNITTA